MAGTTYKMFVSKVGLKEAFHLAEEATAAEAKGWIPLAKVASMEDAGADYRISVRKEDEGKFELGCSCKQWIFGCKKAGLLCKHQAAFLRNGVTDHTATGKVRIWPTKAGQEFRAHFIDKNGRVA